MATDPDVRKGASGPTRKAAPKPPASRPVRKESAACGYMIAMRHPYTGRWLADWDGVIHSDIFTAKAELNEANKDVLDSDGEYAYRLVKLIEL